MGGFMVSGRLDDALRLFADMPDTDRDLVSWNTIFKGYAQQGDMDIATTWLPALGECQRVETSWNTLISGCTKMKEH